MGDHLHSMCVGDSASIVLNTTTLQENWSNWNSRPLSSPCDKSHTFYGVSFYSTTHAAIVGDEGLIFLTTNQGSSWVQSGLSITNQTLRAITRASTALIVVGDSGIVLRSIDSGLTWNRIASSTTRNINAISINSSGTGYFVGEHGLIGKTTDFGASWPIVTDTSAFGYRASSPVTLRGVAISDHDSVIAVGDSGAVGVSTNGISWSAMKPAQIYALYSSDPSIDTLLQQMSFRGVSYSAYRGGNLFQDEWTLFSESDLICGIHRDSVDVSRSYSLAGDADGGTDYIAWRYDCGTARDSTTQAAGAFESLFINNHPLSSIFETFLFASIDSLGYGYGSGTGEYSLRPRTTGSPGIILSAITITIQPTFIRSTRTMPLPSVGLVTFFEHRMVEQAGIATTLMVPTKNVCIALLILLRTPSWSAVISERLFEVQTMRIPGLRSPCRRPTTSKRSHSLHPIPVWRQAETLRSFAQPIEGLLGAM